MIKNILKKIGKDTLKRILDEYIKTKDIEKLIQSIDNEINIQINNEMNINSENSNINNQDVKINLYNSEVGVLNIDEDRDQLIYTRVLKKVQDKLIELIRPDEEILLSLAKISLEGVAYNGYTVNNLREHFMKNVKTIYINRTVKEIDEFEELDDEEKIVFIRVQRKRGFVSTSFLEMAHRWFYENYLKQYM